MKKLKSLKYAYNIFFIAVVIIGLVFLICSYIIFQGPIQISEDNPKFFRAQVLSKLFTDYFDFTLLITKPLPPSLDEYILEYFSQNRKHPEYLKVINQGVKINDFVNVKITRANKTPD